MLREAGSRLLVLGVPVTRLPVYHITDYHLVVAHPRVRVEAMLAGRRFKIANVDVNPAPAVVAAAALLGPAAA